MNEKPLPQERMIADLRRLCNADERLEAAMLYGSFPLGEADRYSDIDCILFFYDPWLPDVDRRLWAGQIGPIELFYTNEFGTQVAIYSNLVRAEFHFDPASSMRKIDDWRGSTWFPTLEAAILVDRNGALHRHLQPLSGPRPDHETREEARTLCDGFLNWYLFGANVLARGEHARALEILHILQDNLLRSVRTLEGRTGHWITPTRSLEAEISAEAYRRYRSCTASLEPGALRAAYGETWLWGNELLAGLSRRHALALPVELIAKLDAELAERNIITRPGV